MKRERLTNARIASFSCPVEKKQAFLWDTEIPRLAIRATSGSKSFIFESKLHRNTIRRTIGDVLHWKLDEAREEARRLQVQIDQGLDPREVELEKREAALSAKAAREAAQRAEDAAKRYTLRALCEAYADHLTAKGKERSARAVRSSFRCHVYPNGEVSNAPANRVTPEQIAALIRKVKETGKERAAGILRSYLSAAFNVAKHALLNTALPSGLIPFQVDSNPVDAIPAIPVRAGMRKLAADELRKYLAALGPQLPDVALKIALYAGGQRMAQLLRTTVADWNPETKVLRLWDGKGKRRDPREHLLPLAPIAAAMVSDLVSSARAREADQARMQGREASFNGLWLFSSHGRVPMTIETPGNRAAKISDGMGGQPFNLRDIRRTVETKLAELKISKDVRAQLLSHGLSGVQNTHYDKYDYFSEKHAALLAWERRLEQIVSGVQTTKVVRMGPDRMEAAA